MIRVLIVEDDFDIRNAYNFALTKAGLKVTQAADGGEAMQAVEREIPDVILLDMLMPGVSGLDFLKQTKITSRFPHTKILALTNIETPRVMEETKQLGVAEYIIKANTTPRAVVEMVQRYGQEAAAAKSLKGP